MLCSTSFTTESLNQVSALTLDPKWCARRMLTVTDHFFWVGRCFASRHIYLG